MLGASFSADVIADALAPPNLARAAGIMLRSDEGLVLFLKRAGPDHAGEWCFPGGSIEEGEDAEGAAIRETEEETGRRVAARRLTPHSRFIRDGVDFTTYLAEVSEFSPVLNEEHSGFAWADPAQPPEPLHPGVRASLAMAGADELTIARMMATEGLASPQAYENFWLFDLRITGTGAAYRAADKKRGTKEEFVWRDPSVWCNEEFLARCNGLPVIFEHPEETALLNGEEFGERIVGTVFLPYIKGEEVWAIAKVWDEPTAELMSNVQLSTSPGVRLAVENLDDVVELEDGRSLLIEGKPSLIDHLAICAQGKWDKAAEPSGVRLDSEQGAIAAMENDTQPGEAESMDDLRARLDAAEARIAELSAARVDSEEGKSEEGDADKADAEDDADEAKMDAEEADEKKADPDKSDSAKADSVAHDDIRRRLSELDRRIPQVLSDADLNEMATAQDRADAVASGFGKKASRPMPGEAPIAYRRRLVGMFKEHSADWKDVDLSKLDGASFGIAERAIYASAEAAAARGVDVPRGQLRAVVKQDSTGRRITEFQGRPSAWMDRYKTRPKFASGFNRTPHRQEA